MVNKIMGEIGAVVSGNRGGKEGLLTENAIPYGGMVRVPQFIVAHHTQEPVTVGGLTFSEHIRPI